LNGLLARIPFVAIDDSIAIRIVAHDTLGGARRPGSGGSRLIVGRGEGGHGEKKGGGQGNKFRHR
jgi:hypothetical protein